MSLGWRLLTSGIYGGPKKKGKDDAFTKLEKPPYTGARPYTAAEIGFDAPRLKSIADQYTGQISERSRGEGLVGFDPAYRSTLKNEFLADFDDYSDETMRQASAQASGQGLRGGIPASISANYAKNLSRARQSGLAGIDVADLEARRADINAATYAQPGAIQMGAGAQQGRAAFDLAEYNATLPDYIENPQDPSILPALIGAAGTIGGAYVGGPAGAMAGGSIANAFTQSQTKRNPYSGYYSEADIYGSPLLKRGRSNIY